METTNEQRQQRAREWELIDTFKAAAKTYCDWLREYGNRCISHRIKSADTKEKIDIANSEVEIARINYEVARELIRAYGKSEEVTK